ncbi:8ae1c4b8-d329-43d6-a685-5e33e0466f68 [Thermothielavioides terrestris]|nr:8ae1c4b8-d329-43d6-a685-5e33e0466f68 [Thermothielavioides terrestris]
MSSLLV